MKNVRIFFNKLDRMKFVSHLDMNRFFSRMIRLSELPIWYTEGFNPHPYITFALPLSLGFESVYEIVDLKITDDTLSNDEIKERLSKVMPVGIVITEVAEPEMKTAVIGFSEYEIIFENCRDNFGKLLEDFLTRDEILFEKKTKKGEINKVNAAEKIKSYSVHPGNTTVLKIVLPAGSKDNVNPQSVMEVLKNETEGFPVFGIKKTCVYDENMNIFR